MILLYLQFLHIFSNFHTILDWTTPLAIHTPIVLYRDLNGSIINDINDFSENMCMQSIYLCVFPLEGKTVILLFHHKDDRKYKSFDRQFSRLSFDEKLMYINYYIFKYTEHAIFHQSLTK